MLDIYSDKGKVIINGNCRLTYCIDCGVEEPLHYMVKNEIWDQANLNNDIVCMSCLEKRIKRNLIHRDLTANLINRKFKNPLIFLDIDGVLNEHECHPRTRYCSIDKECANHLDRLLIDTDANIVLISSWRYLSKYMNLIGLRNLLHTHWVDGERLIGWTRKDDRKISDRGKQIKEWLENHRLFNKYVVVDNYDFDITIHGHPFVKIESRLNSHYCEQICEILK